MLYALYKQGTIGDNTTEQPGLLAMTERAKWDAWNKVKGMEPEAARGEYIRFAGGLVTKMGGQGS